IMGPWIHGSQDRSAHGQVSFGADAAMSQPGLWWQEWFDHFLKGKDNGVGKAPPFSSRVRIFVMGTGDHTKDAQGRMTHGGRWRDEREWPLARTRYTSYYLQPGGGLKTEVPGTGDSVTSFTFDPHDPVPTIGGNISSGDGILLQGGWDQRGRDTVWNWPRPIPLSTRSDVVVFQTPRPGGDQHHLPRPRASFAGRLADHPRSGSLTRGVRQGHDHAGRRRGLRP